MTSFGNISRVSQSSESLTSQNILEFYNATLVELQNCASIKPAANSIELSVGKTEDVLLSLEADLLNAAADVKLTGHEDLQNLIEVWVKASSIGDTQNMRPSDRIAWNIFQYVLAVSKPTN